MNSICCIYETYWVLSSHCDICYLSLSIQAFNFPSLSLCFSLSAFEMGLIVSSMYYDLKKMTENKSIIASLSDVQIRSDGDFVSIHWFSSSQIFLQGFRFGLIVCFFGLEVTTRCKN